MDLKQQVTGTQWSLYSGGPGLDILFEQRAGPGLYQKLNGPGQVLTFDCMQWAGLK